MTQLALDLTYRDASGREDFMVSDCNAQAVTWIVRTAKPVKIEIKAETQTAWRDARTVDLGGAK